MPSSSSSSFLTKSATASHASALSSTVIGACAPPGAFSASSTDARSTCSLAKPTPNRLCAMLESTRQGVLRLSYGKPSANAVPVVAVQEPRAIALQRHAHLQLLPGWLKHQEMPQVMRVPEPALKLRSFQAAAYLSILVRSLWCTLYEGQRTACSC